MKRIPVYFFLIFLLAAYSCKDKPPPVRYSALSNKLDFDKELWAYSENKDKRTLWETREFMMDDLLNNYLHYGMEREAIVGLLGEPYIETGVHYTWKPFPLDTNRAAYRIHRDSMRIFAIYRNDPGLPVLRYNVGFTRYGPNMFIVVLDRRNGKLADVLTLVAIE